MPRDSGGDPEMSSEILIYHPQLVDRDRFDPAEKETVEIEVVVG